MLFSAVYTEAHPRRSPAFGSRTTLRDAALAPRMNLRVRPIPRPFPRAFPTLPLRCPSLTLLESTLTKVYQNKGL
jgi:hypothetical protein